MARPENQGAEYRAERGDPRNVCGRFPRAGVDRYEESPLPVDVRTNVCASVAICAGGGTATPARAFEVLVAFASDA